MLYVLVALVAVRHIVVGGVRRAAITSTVAQARLDLSYLRASQPDGTDHAFVYVCLLLDKVERLPVRHHEAIARSILGPSTGRTLRDLREPCQALRILATLPSDKLLRPFAAQKIQQLGRYESVLADSYMLRLNRTPGKSGMREILLATADQLIEYELAAHFGHLSRARATNFIIALGATFGTAATLVSSSSSLALWGAVSGLLATLAVRPNYEQGSLYVLSLLIGPPLGVLAASVVAVISEEVVVTDVYPFLSPIILAVVFGALAGSVGARFVSR